MADIQTPDIQMRSSAPSLLAWMLFVIAYVVLDWASYLHAMYGLNITPWNPSLALGLVCFLLYGRRTAVPWFAGVLVSELVVRGMPATVVETVSLSICMVLGYSMIAEALRRYVSQENFLCDQRRLVTWAVIVMIGTFATSVTYIALLGITDLIPVGDWATALGRFWVGDFVGIIVTMPFFWILLTRYKTLLSILVKWETMGYALLSVVALWTAFGRGEASEFQYFYLLFLPLVWAAARQGVAGAAVASFLLQAGIIGAAQLLQLVAVTVFELQMLGAVLAFVGLFIGTVVDEKQKISSDLRLTLRLAAAGEMAGALAHELNQPLTALSAYGVASEALLNNGETGDRLKFAIQNMVKESRRAGDVVRRLRDFFRTGATKLEIVSIDELLESASEPYVEKAKELSIDLLIASAGEMKILGDRLQLQVVFRNLLANAVDAAKTAPIGNRKISVSTRAEGGKRISIWIEDSGPGIAGQGAMVFDAFHSTKTSGLGLGLAISRAIIEAHGGTLIAEETNHGWFKVTLQIEEEFSSGA